MGNWTDRFDPETVDEIKRYEVGEGDFLLAARSASARHTSQSGMVTFISSMMSTTRLSGTPR